MNIVKKISFQQSGDFEGCEIVFLQLEIELLIKIGA